MPFLFTGWYLASSQEGPRTMVGIATFDSSIHFYNLKRNLQQVCEFTFLLCNFHLIYVLYLYLTSNESVPLLDMRTPVWDTDTSLATCQIDKCVLNFILYFYFRTLAGYFLDVFPKFPSQFFLFTFHIWDIYLLLLIYQRLYLSDNIASKYWLV